eukprot:365854-Chlamydomonas_euryale.AAC.1
MSPASFPASQSPALLYDACTPVHHGHAHLCTTGMHTCAPRACTPVHHRQKAPWLIARGMHTCAPKVGKRQRG